MHNSVHYPENIFLSMRIYSYLIILLNTVFLSLYAYKEDENTTVAYTIRQTRRVDNVLMV